MAFVGNNLVGSNNKWLSNNITNSMFLLHYKHYITSNHYKYIGYDIACDNDNAIDKEFSNLTRFLVPYGKSFTGEKLKETSWSLDAKWIASASGVALRRRRRNVRSLRTWSQIRIKARFSPEAEIVNEVLYSRGDFHCALWLRELDINPNRFTYDSGFCIWI